MGATPAWFSRLFGSAMWAAVLVCTSGVTVSLAVGASLNRREKEASELQFDRQVSVATVDVSSAVNRYRDTMQTLAGAWGAFENPTAEKFAQVTRPLTSMHFPGATSVVFLVPAPDDAVTAVQDTWRRRGSRSLALTPTGGGREHIFSIFSTVLDGHTVARHGIDVTQSRFPTQALNESRRSGQVTISDPYQLIIDQSLPADQRQQSFSLTAPVYGNPDRAGARKFEGWILMGLRGRDFIGATLERVGQDLVDIGLYAPRTDGTQPLVAADLADVAGRRDLTDEVRISVADRHWVLRMAASAKRLPGGDTHSPLVAVIVGTALSALTAGLVYVLATGRRRAMDHVLRATTALAATGADLVTARDDLLKQKGYLTEVLDAIDVAVVTCDVDGTLVHANLTARRTSMQIPSTADAGAAPLSALHHLDGTVILAEQHPLRHALHDNVVTGMEMTTKAPDGAEKTVMAHTRPLHDEAGRVNGAVAVFVDISVLRDREAELKAFAGVVAHDLRAPLTSIGGYAEIVVDSIADGAPTAQLRDGLGRIRAGVDRMRTLIDDLLAYAVTRDASLRLEAVDLQTLVADVVAERTAHLRDTAGPIRPEVYVGALPVVHADRAMIRQLLDNLIGNALKYRQPDQSAHVDISSHRRDDDGDLAFIQVADRGIGIPAVDHSHVFTTFHRADAHRNYSGTGLGLAICQRVVHRHGGTIEVSDNPGGGTRMTFSLPRVTVGQDDAEPGRVASPDSPSSVPRDTSALS